MGYWDTWDDWGYVGFGDLHLQFASIPFSKSFPPSIQWNCQIQGIPREGLIRLTAGDSAFDELTRRIVRIGILGPNPPNQVNQANQNPFGKSLKTQTESTKSGESGESECFLEVIENSNRINRI